MTVFSSCICYTDLKNNVMKQASASINLEDDGKHECFRCDAVSLIRHPLPGEGVRHCFRGDVCIKHSLLLPPWWRVHKIILYYRRISPSNRLLSSLRNNKPSNVPAKN